MDVKIEESWRRHIGAEFDKQYFIDLAEFVRREYTQHTCYPPGRLIFNAFNLCPFDQVKVVIIGQDPYHEPGQAHGLSFSVGEGVTLPPSLVNIFKEIQLDLGTPMPASGDLTRWAKQGVLLLNATLTVRAHQAASHQRHGWEEFTDAAIRALNADRDHPPRANVSGRLRDYIDDIVQQRAKLIIPAFSVGRTQQILFFLNGLIRDKKIPQVPIYVDSPLSLKATKIYARHTDCYGQAASDLLRQGIELFKMPGLQFLETADQSKALNHAEGPMVIIAASGMCEGGRILHHLQNGVEDPRNIILIVGYQAEGTLGRRIVEHQTPLKILGDTFELRARVHTINALSAHADRTALRDWVRAVNAKGTIKKAFAVHGEDDKVTAMCQILREEGYKDPVAPVQGAIYKGL